MPAAQLLKRGQEEGRCRPVPPRPPPRGLTSAVVLVPGVRAVLNPVADQGVVDAHAAVAEEGAARAGSCGRRGNRVAEDGGAWTASPPTAVMSALTPEAPRGRGPCEPRGR